jgi:protein involved in polysaccharide export with SLBB domain
MTNLKISFFWSSNSDISPIGTINLLHTVPMNQSIEDQLVKIKVGDRVTVKGWEIYDIRAFSNKGNYIGTWKDSGCNSMLVTEVTINQN